MAVETKKMANSIAAAGGSFGERVKSWPERIKTFYNDVRTEMRKVTAPSCKEVQATTTVVVITVFIFAVYFWVIDFVIQQRRELSVQAVQGSAAEMTRAQRVKKKHSLCRTKKKTKPQPASAARPQSRRRGRRCRDRRGAHATRT